MYQITLTPERSDRERYSTIVSYEGRGTRQVAVRRTFELDDRGVLRCVRVTELSRIPGIRTREWPRKLDPAPEPEALRRARIMSARDAAHGHATQEPDWRLAL
jgi:hypothetical protein